ncbi:class I SAM-dependent methyltransferase [Planctomycetaceae bacterium SH139]
MSKSSDSAEAVSTSSPKEDPFHDFYDREQPAYGLKPSSELDQYLAQCKPRGRALDLGAGAGRDTLALARAGLEVTSVDLSAQGLRLIGLRADESGFGARVTTEHCDVREFDFPTEHYEVIVATTVLDHLPPPDANVVWEKILGALTPTGTLYLEVHTTDDPGCDGCTSTSPQAPVSETAQWVINYYARGQLLHMAAASGKLRVLRYEERYEWDYTHGPEHKHAKAILLATTAAADPAWYGHPAAFPRHASE